MLIMHICKILSEITSTWRAGTALCKSRTLFYQNKSVCSRMCCVFLLDIIVLQQSRIWILIYKMLYFFPLKLSFPQCWSVSTVKTLPLPASSEAPKGSAPCHVPRGIFNMHETLHMQRKPRWTNHILYTLGCSLIAVTLHILNKWGSLRKDCENLDYEKMKTS